MWNSSYDIRNQEEEEDDTGNHVLRTGTTLLIAPFFRHVSHRFCVSPFCVLQSLRFDTDGLDFPPTNTGEIGAYKDWSIYT